MAPNRPVLDSLIVTIGGFLERSVGTITALALKWGLDPTQHGIYSGLRLFLNHSNLSGLGIGRGAIQEIPVLCGAGRENDARKVGASGFTACAIGALCYTIVLVMVVLWRTLGGGSATWSDPIGRTWTIGLLVVALLVLLKRYQDFLIALHRAYQRLGLITGLAIADAALELAEGAASRGG